MMKNYASIDDSNICIGVSQLNAEVSDSNLIEIEKCDEDYIWRKYENGVWSTEKYLPPAPIQPPVNPIDMLGMVTTQNSIELSELKQQVEAIGQGVVEIMLNQQLGGM